MDEPKVTQSDKSGRTTLWLVAGFGSLLLIILVFAAQRGGNPDRLDENVGASLPDAAENSAECSGNSIVNALKRGLFDAAAEGRPGDAEAFRQVASSAVARMENAALESEDGDRLDCSGSLAIDLPPGIVASGDRRHLMGNVDFSVDRNGRSVEIRNASSLVNALAGLARTAQGMARPIGETPPEGVAQDQLPDGNEPPPPPRVQPEPSPAVARPSFNCNNARTRGELAVCADPGLAALDRQMASQYQRAMADLPPGGQSQLRRSRDRFLAFRDRCSDDSCIAEAYQGRMREISDIAAGRWQPPR